MPLEAGKTTPPVLQVPATPARVGALLIDEGGKPVESPGIWGTPALIILIVAMLVVAVVMLLLFRRKRKA
jgi:galactitol-specific phosphotransferase system IIC component